MIELTSLPLHTLSALEWIGTAAFAISGVLSAMRKNMDMVGVCVCGFLAAFGGGTLRDILMDRRPFFWADHQAVLIGVCVLCVGVTTFFRQHQLERRQNILQTADAIGLGLFTASGMHLSWSSGQPAVVAIMMGVITGTFGGVLRDVVCNEIPQLFHDHRPYAVCALAGCVSYAVLSTSSSASWLTVTACAVVTVSLRLLALWLNWRLPAIAREQVDD